MKHFSTLSFAGVMLFGFAVESDAQTFSRKPFLQLGTPTKASVCWRVSPATSLTVRFGTDSTNLSRTTAASASSTDACVVLDTLTPNTKYFYQVYNGLTPVTGAVSQYVKTGPPIGTRNQKYNFWVIGDFGTGLGPQANVRNGFTKVNGSNHIDGVLMLGDNAYEQGTDAQATAGIFTPYANILANSFAWPALGNHDGMTSSGAAHIAAWSLPSLAQAGGVASNSELYYSFNYGNIHFVILDSELSSRTKTGPQYLWLEQDLQASTSADWLVVTFHHPPFTRASHNSETENKHVEMRYTFMPLLESYGVDWVLSGHSHDYERSFLLDSAYGASNSVSSTAHDAWYAANRSRVRVDSGSGNPTTTGAYHKSKGGNNGAVYAVVGSSAKQDGTGSLHPMMFIQHLRYGSSILEFQDSTATMRFLDTTGLERDRVQIIKNFGTTSVREAADAPLKSAMRAFDHNGRMFRFAADNAVPLRVFTLGGRLVYEGTPRGAWEASHKEFASGEYYFRHGATLGKISLQ